MNMKTANLISPSGFNTAVGLVSFQSNTNSELKAIRGFGSAVTSEKKNSRVWRVRGGLPAFAHEPAQTLTRRIKPKQKPKP